MQTVAWQCEGHEARLRLAELAASVRADRPGEGLGQVSVLDHPWPGARLLGVAAMSPDGAADPLDWHLCGTDLAAAYVDSLDPAVRIDLVWRTIRPGGVDRFLAAVDLIVSLRTERLESRPEVVVESLLPGATVTADRPAADFHWFWRPNLPWSYVQMAHPADLRRDETATEPGPVAATRLRHFLFPPQPLEKGVILRARVRGVFLPREADAKTAAACYDAMVAAEPPLGR